jgi:cytochrome c oxidase subunit 2
MRTTGLRSLLIAFAVAIPSTTPGAAAKQTAGPRVIEISAERFEFWPSEIAIAEGEEVELRIRSDDTLHGFRILGGGVNVLVPKRGKGYATARFTGTRPGRYTFECSRMCGAGHNFMRGVLIVRSATGAAP